ncbi:proteasome assembly chaperone family protein, partial [Dietzia sp.]|uniref:proteasome assembly chaperone family protein n=1 Tax=Dietzia sp. TaxID=1871616 RepID=UPI002FD9C002
MSTPNDLYRLVFPTPSLTEASGKGPVLVHGLEGFSDAGRAVRQATEHIRSANHSELVARFDADELVDYRSRRPAMDYSFDHFAGYAEPHISLHAITTPSDQTFLLLSGLEPDLRWGSFVDAVSRLSADFGVRIAVGLGSMPLNVPHTRPLRSSAHSKDIELLEGFSTWPGEFRLPGSADSLLEYKLSEQGFSTMGFTAHVPQYLAQSEYPATAIR